MSMHYLTLLPKVEGALLIFTDGTQHPPSKELSDADVQALIGMCQEYLAWRGAQARPEVITERFGTGGAQ